MNRPHHPMCRCVAYPVTEEPTQPMDFDYYQWVMDGMPAYGLPTLLGDMD